MNESYEQIRDYISRLLEDACCQCRRLPEHEQNHLLAALVACWDQTGDRLTPERLRLMVENIVFAYDDELEPISATQRAQSHQHPTYGAV